MITQGLFFQIIQVAIGTRSELSQDLSIKEWEQLYAICTKQSLIGVGYVGITRLPKVKRPPMFLFAQWIYDAENIKDKNEKLSKECTALCQQLEQDGISACIIKGQSNYVNYPEWLRDYRTPGDIDALMRPKDACASYKGIRGSIEYCIEQCRIHNVPVGKICYHHLDMPWNGNTEVEAHHRATWLNSFIRNRRLQTWLENNMPFADGKAKVGEVEFNVASTQYNTIYQLLHIYKHLFEEGIGLRQILDYYFVLQTLNKEYGTSKNNEIIKTLDRFGMKRLASAMMYVLQKVFAMPDDYLLCQPNEKEGRFLLNEIMMAGNFGRYDERIDHNGGTIKHAWEKTKHNMRLLEHYPEEVMWEPVFRIYHFLWRKLKLWKL